jgi:NAD(P)-dependent dehydrogenase (short-subunit alcohol dehydrogenase family)
MSELPRTARVAVVTGAGSGIGRAIAARLSADGVAVGLVGRTASTLEAVASELAGESFVAVADVADRQAVEGAFDAIQARLGALDILVANAGIGGPNELEPGRDRWDAIVRTNLDGAYFCLRAFEGRLAPSAETRHAIVISSCVARFGVAGISAYSAAKAGQLGLVRSLAVELAPRRVLVNAICPGWVDTGMAEDRMGEIGAERGLPYPEARRELLAELPLQRISQPEEIAALAAFLVSPEAVAFTGQAFDPNNGAWMG